MRWLGLLMISILMLGQEAYAEQPLPAEQAFRLSAAYNSDQTINLHWQIAPGYYLYKDRIHISSSNPAIRLSNLVLPSGIAKEDEIFGKYQVYQDELHLNFAVAQSSFQTLPLSVSYQGCSAAGFCYPPVNKTIELRIEKALPSNTSAIDPVNDSDQINHLFNQHNFWLIVLSFFGFGLLLALTPCVWPMVPILSSIILGQGKQLTAKQSFYLSLIYVLSMAISYAGTGILAAAAGSYLQASLQNPWILGTFSLVFLAMALALFDCYTLRLPLQERFNNLVRQQQGGTYLGVAIMGALSILIVSPCVSAPLVGALTYIGKTGDRWLGGSALFALGLGMGLPLLILGSCGNKCLPKAGPWMDAIKTFFGILLLGVAISLLQRIIPGQIAMLLWAALAIGCSTYLNAFTSVPQGGWYTLGKGLGILIAAYALLLLIGASQGNTDPLHPIVNRSITPDQPYSVLTFQRIKTLAEAKHALLQAQNTQQMVMLDFYADWCLACKQMERSTFQDIKVQHALKKFVLLQVDITANDANAKALARYFKVIAPPTLLFFDTQGQELIDKRVIGAINTEKFLQNLFFKRN